MSFNYVVRPEELSALNFLAPNHPRPTHAEWIDRGRDRPLRKQSVDLLLRTLFTDILSPSVVKLHRSAGLRLEFRSEAERLGFSNAFSEAKASEHQSWSERVTVLFDDRLKAAAAAEELVANGVGKESVSILWRAGQFMDTDHQWVEGHSLLSVAGVTAGGSIAGLALGVALIAVPGVGQIAAVGGLALSAVQAAPLVTGIFGATAAAISKAFSDPDVDDFALKQYTDQHSKARAFVSVDLSGEPGSLALVRSILKSFGGRPAIKSG
jgi:hypothetical protein